VIVRIVLWSLADAHAGYEELREQLPPLDEPSAWLWNDATERFGALLVAEDDLPDGLAAARALIGKEPEVYEEFEAV
jgi:hypothetical protein